MIKLALELPTSKLSAWSSLCDLDFVLAHKVLEDPEYARFFAMRPPNREVILDNSTHEFGHPIPFDDLRRATQLSRADFVIAPDIVEPDITDAQFQQNIAWMEETCRGIADAKIAAVLCGPSMMDREFYIESAVRAKYVKMLCFSFHDPLRYEYFQEIVRNGLLRGWERIHLLGMSTIAELRRWYQSSEAFPGIEWSFDTCKPLKLGLAGTLLSSFPENQSLRGGTVKSKEILDLNEFTDEQENTIVQNIHFLRAICSGDA